MPAISIKYDCESGEYKDKRMEQNLKKTLHWGKVKHNTRTSMWQFWDDCPKYMQMHTL